MAWRAVSDKQWEVIRQHLPKRKRSRKGGRPPLDERQCFEGILWILWTGAPWSELPERYGSKSAVHRHLKEWAESEVLLTTRCEHCWSNVGSSRLSRHEATTESRHIKTAES